MNVGELAKHSAICVRRHVDLVTAADAMRKGHVGCVVVTEPIAGHDGERPIGIVTDRDIVTAVIARAVEPRDLLVDDVMTRDPAVTEVDCSVESALRQMRDRGVRRLPVVDGQGRFVSVLSQDDVVDYLAEQLSMLAGAIHKEIRAETTARP